MRMSTSAVAAAVILGGALAARAQVAVDIPISPSIHQWSVDTGETVNPGHDLVSAEVGWPGLTLGYTHGLSDRTDIGLKFDLLYSIENTTNTHFGLGLRVPFRAVVARSGGTSVLVHADPGIKLYPSVSSTDDQGVTSSSSLFGFQLPVGAQVGFALAKNLRAEVGADLLTTLSVTGGSDLVLSPLFGAGLEYFVDRNLSLGLDTRFGPVFIPTANGAGTNLGFRTQLVAGYRL